MVGEARKVIRDIGMNTTDTHLLTGVAAFPEHSDRALNYLAIVRAICSPFGLIFESRPRATTIDGMDITYLRVMCPFIGRN
jgi:hypothetical protein